MSDEKSVSPAEGEKESAFSDIEVDDGEDALLSFLKGVKVPSAKAKRREDSLQDKSAAWMQMYNKKLRELKAKYSKKKATKSMRQAAKDYVDAKMLRLAKEGKGKNEEEVKKTKESKETEKKDVDAKSGKLKKTKSVKKGDGDQGKEDTERVKGENEPVKGNEQTKSNEQGKTVSDKPKAANKPKAVSKPKTDKPNRKGISPRTSASSSSAPRINPQQPPRILLKPPMTVIAPATPTEPSNAAAQPAKPFSSTSLPFVANGTCYTPPEPTMEFTPMGYVDVSSGAMQPMMQMPTTPAIYMPSDSAMGFTPMGYVDVSGGTMQPVMSVASTPMAYAAVSTPYVASSPYSHVIFADASVNRFPQSRQPLSGASMPNAANATPFTPTEAAGRIPTPSVPQSTLKPLKKGDAFIPTRPLSVAPKPSRNPQSGAMPTIVVASKSSAPQNPFTDKANPSN